MMDRSIERTNEQHVVVAMRVDGVACHVDDDDEDDQDADAAA